MNINTVQNNFFLLKTQILSKKYRCIHCS